MSSPDGSCVVRDERGVRVLVFDRIPKRNAITLPMFAAVAEQLEDAASNPQVRAVLLSGAGGDYTAGHDLGAFGGWPQRSGDPVPRALQALAALPKPLVIAVQGVAMGFGTTSLLHADWSVCTAQARLRLPFIDLGIGPEAASSLLLAKTVGAGRARGWMHRGCEFSGADAHAAGLVHELARATQLRAIAMDRALELAAKDPLTTQAMKRLLRPPAALLRATIDAEIDAINAALARRAAGDPAMSPQPSRPIPR